MLQNMSIAADETRRAIARFGYAGARVEIADLCGRHPGDSTLHAFFALTLLATGEFEQAADVIAPFDDGSASILAIEAELAILHGDREEAQALLNRARNLDPDDYLVLRSLPEEALAATESDALALLARARSLYPDDPVVHGREAHFLVDRWKVDECRVFLDESPDWFRETAQYEACRGRLALKLHDAVEAERRFDNATRLCPGCGYWSPLALAQLVQGKYTEAEHSAKVALSLNPRAASAFRALARIAEGRGDIPARDEFQRQAAESAPAHSRPAWIQQGIDLVRENRWDDAIQLFRPHATEAPLRYAAFARKTILRILCRRERWDEAREQLDEIERMGEYKSSMDCFRCQLQFHEGKKEKAIEEMRQLLRSRSQPEVVFLVATEMFLAGSDSDFKDLIERLVADPPSSAQVAALIVIKLITSKKLVSARRVLMAARAKFPDSVGLKRQEIRFALDEGDASRAKRLFRELPPGRRDGFRWSSFARARLIGFLRKRVAEA